MYIYTHVYRHTHTHICSALCIIGGRGVFTRHKKIRSPITSCPFDTNHNPCLPPAFHTAFLILFFFFSPQLNSERIGPTLMGPSEDQVFLPLTHSVSPSLPLLYCLCKLCAYHGDRPARIPTDSQVLYKEGPGQEELP